MQPSLLVCPDYRKTNPHQTENTIPLFWESLYTDSVKFDIVASRNYINTFLNKMATIEDLISLSFDEKDKIVEN